MVYTTQCYCCCVKYPAHRNSKNRVYPLRCQDSGPPGTPFNRYRKQERNKQKAKHVKKKTCSYYTYLAQETPETKTISETQRKWQRNNTPRQSNRSTMRLNSKRVSSKYRICCRWSISWSICPTCDHPSDTGGSGSRFEYNGRQMGCLRFTKFCLVGKHKNIKSMKPTNSPTQEKLG